MFFTSGTIVVSQCVLKKACPSITCTALQTYTSLPPNSEFRYLKGFIFQADSKFVKL